MGEELTLSGIEQKLLEYEGKAVEGFYVKGKLLDNKQIDKRGANHTYISNLLDSINTEHITLEAKYTVTPEKDGQHHKMDITGKGMGGSVMHEITINYFVMQDPESAADIDPVEEMKNPIENVYSKNGFVDISFTQKHHRVGIAGAMLGYFAPWPLKNRSDFMIYTAVKFAKAYEHFFGKKE